MKYQQHPPYVEEGTSSFISGLVSMLENEPAVLKWNRNDRSSYSVVIKSANSLASILPKYFKSNNVNSFVRQLNLYGFKKMAVRSKDIWEFYHPLFQMDKPELFSKIKRKSNDKSEVTVLDELIATRAELDELRKKYYIVLNRLSLYEKISEDHILSHPLTFGNAAVPNVPSDFIKDSPYFDDSSSTLSTISNDTNSSSLADGSDSPSTQIITKRPRVMQFPIPQLESNVHHSDFQSPIFPSLYEDPHLIAPSVFPTVSSFSVEDFPPMPSLATSRTLSFIDDISSSVDLWIPPEMPIQSAAPSRCFCGADGCYSAPLHTLSTPSMLFRLGLVHSFMTFFDSLAESTACTAIKAIIASCTVADSDGVNHEEAFHKLLLEFNTNGVPSEKFCRVMDNLRVDPHVYAIDHALRIMKNLSEHIEDPSSSGAIDSVADFDKISFVKSSIKAYAERIQNSSLSEIRALIESNIPEEDRVPYLFKMGECVGTETPKSPEELYTILASCDGDGMTPSSQFLLLPFFHSPRSCQLFLAVKEKSVEICSETPCRYVSFMKQIAVPDVGVLV